MREDGGGLHLPVQHRTREPDAILEFDDGMEIFITFDEEDDEDGSG